MLAAGFSLAFLSGMAVALWVKQYGDWHDGMRWERQLLLALHVPLPRWLDTVLYIVPWAGTNISLMPGVFIAVVWLWARAHRPHLAMRLLVVQIGSYLLNPALKDLYERTRPTLFERRGWYGWSSYPSGHAIAGIAVLLTVAMMLHSERGWRWPFYVAGTIIPLNLYSRLYLGVHWPTDVIGGALVGIVWLVMTTLAFRSKGRRSHRRPLSS